VSDGVVDNPGEISGESGGLLGDLGLVEGFYISIDV